MSKQTINKRGGLSMFVKIQEIYIEVTHQITIFTLPTKGVKQIIYVFIKHPKICIRGSVYDTYYDISILMKYIFIYFNKNSFI